jgi:hypothetical protein
MKTYFVTVFSLVIALVACGGSSSGDGSNTDSNGTAPAGSCAAAGTRLCQRACACSTDGKCHVASKTDAGASATINFDNEEKCKDLYVIFGCVGGGDTSLDYGACDSAIAASTCVAGAGGSGILFPDACKSKK